MNFYIITYLYATSYFGLPLVEDKAYLVPAAHDEWPIYLPIWDKWFSRPKKLIFSTKEEQDFVQQRFTDVEFESEIIGIGIDLPSDVIEKRFRDQFSIDGKYILYIGRIDESKGCKELFSFFQKFKKEYNCSLKLVLIGNEVMPVPSDKDIIGLGYVDEQTKFDAISGCELLVNPSPYESLSIVLLEAWSLNKPVLVSKKSEVMVGQCKRSLAGFWYDTYEEFVRYILDILEEKISIAGRGRKYIEENYSWETIINKYSSFLTSHNW